MDLQRYYFGPPSGRHAEAIGHIEKLRVQLDSMKMRSPVEPDLNLLRVFGRMLDTIESSVRLHHEDELRRSNFRISADQEALQ